jgi:hypothetical protein
MDLPGHRVINIKTPHRTPASIPQLPTRRWMANTCHMESRGLARDSLRPVATRDLHQLQARGNSHFRSLGVCHHETHHPNAVCQLTLPSPMPPLVSSKKPEQTQRPLNKEKREECWQ